MKANRDTNAFAQMGMAAMLPGMVHMLELMQAEVSRFQIQLAALQGMAAAPSPKVGRPPGAKNKKTRNSGWPADPEARKAEFKRRQRVARKAKALKLEKAA